MNWEMWLQMFFAFMAGAWVYACGSKQAQVLPGHAMVERVSAAVAERVRGNGKREMPGLPRITS